MAEKDKRSNLYLGPDQPGNEAAAATQQAWDRLVFQNNRFTKPASDEDFNNPLSVVDGCNWLNGDIRGQSVLCLAAGGGRQGPLYAAAGGQVTVVDISPAMLAIDRDVAQQRNLQLKTVMTTMEDLSMFKDDEFDLVVHPVSTCYVADLEPVYREVARVIRDGGVYISQHKQPVSLQLNQTLEGDKFFLEQTYYREGPLPTGVVGSLIREPGTQEFLHRWEQLIGWMCRCGFVIEDLIEPVHAKPNPRPGSFAHHSSYVAPYVRIKARRR